MKEAYYVYVLRSETSGRYYIGHTHDLAQRLRQHNLGVATATRAGCPWKLVYLEKYATRAQAARRERGIKRQKSRQWIQRLIDGNASISQNAGAAR